MNLTILAATEKIGSPVVNMGIFVTFVIITLAIVIRVGRRNTNAAEYFTGGHAFTGRQNGIAIAGDYLSAASFLGIAGAVAVYGYDGFLYSIGFLVGWPVVTFGGMAARLLTELVAFDGPVTWEVLARELWPDEPDRHALRRRLDVTVARLRARLRDERVRSDLLRADGSGCFQLVLYEGDSVEDRA